MIISTTPTLDGRLIRTYRGVIGTEVTFVMPSISTDVFIGDFAISLTNTPSAQIFESARKLALNELLKQARAINANAIVGVAFAFNLIGSRNQILLNAVATAVEVGETEEEKEANRLKSVSSDASCYYVKLASGDHGPVFWEDVVKMYNDGEINETTLICETESREWTHIKSFLQS